MHEAATEIFHRKAQILYSFDRIKRGTAQNIVEERVLAKVDIMNGSNDTTKAVGKLILQYIQERESEKANYKASEFVKNKWCIIRIQIKEIFSEVIDVYKERAH